MTCHGREFVRTTRSAWPVRIRSRARSCIEGGVLLRNMSRTYAAYALRRCRRPRRSAPGPLYTSEFACISPSKTAEAPWMALSFADPRGAAALGQAAARADSPWIP